MAAVGGDTFANAGSEVALKALIGIFGSPVAVSNFGSTNIIKNKSGFINKAVSSATDQVSSLLKNGFVNPLAFDPVNNQITDPESNSQALFNPFGFGYSPTIGNALGVASGVVDLAAKTIGALVLKANVSTGYKLSKTGEKLFLNRPITVQVLEMKRIESRFSTEKNRIRTGYKCMIIDPSLLGEELFGQEVECFHEDIFPLPDVIFANTALLPGLAALATGPVTVASNLAGDALKKLASNSLPQIGGANTSIANSAVDLATDLLATNESKFMLAENNPFVRGFETTAGRGLAGKLGGITFDWISEFPWETDHNARAPMGVKISFNLDVIHDLPPGLDHSGYNRAPLYNVGDIMKGISGDVYNDDGIAGEGNYKKSGNIKKG